MNQRPPTIDSGDAVDPGARPVRSFDLSALDRRQELALPKIEAPKGGGAIRGISETFRASSATGTGSFSISLGISPGRQNFSPQLSLEYDSGQGNGAFGLGWSVAAPHIARKTSKNIPEYTEEDIFVLTGSDDLVLVSNTPRQLGTRNYRVDRFRARVETSFTRVERWIDILSGEIFWRTLSPTNVVSIFGASDASRIFDPEDRRRISAWLLEESRDDRGNIIRYEYKAEDLGADPLRRQ